MVTVKNLIEMLKQVPDCAQVHAYEGESIGLAIRDGEKIWWIEAGDTDSEDSQHEFRECLEMNRKTR